MHHTLRRKQNSQNEEEGEGEGEFGKNKGNLTVIFKFKNLSKEH